MPADQTPASARRTAYRLLAALALCGASALCAQAVAGEAAAKEVTLPADATVSVDLRGAQSAAEQAEAKRRLDAANAMPDAAARAALVPEFLLIQRKALADLSIVASHPEGAAQTWYLRSATPPDLFAQRVIARLLGAGFSTVPGCPVDEWSGAHGSNRVAVRIGKREVMVHLTPAKTPC